MALLLLASASAGALSPGCTAAVDALAANATVSAAAAALEAEANEQRSKSEVTCSWATSDCTLSYVWTAAGPASAYQRAVLGAAAASGKAAAAVSFCPVSISHSWVAAGSSRTASSGGSGATALAVPTACSREDREELLAQRAAASCPAGRTCAWAFVGKAPGCAAPAADAAPAAGSALDATTSGACSDSADVAALTSGWAANPTTVASCAATCFMQPEQCASSCLAKLGYSAPCTACWTTFAVTNQRLCALACMSATSPSCLSCTRRLSFPTLGTCSGLSCDATPNCEADSSASNLEAVSEEAAAGGGGGEGQVPPAAVAGIVAAALVAAVALVGVRRRSQHQARAAQASAPQRDGQELAVEAHGSGL